MKLKSTLAAILLNFFCLVLFAQQPPLVYTVENTGAQYQPPAFPSYAQLPVIQRLPDPFTFFYNGSRDTTFASWERRRNEIKASIEKYEIGPKPMKSDLTITAVYTPGTGGGILEVHVLRNSNGQSLTLTSKINLPSGTAPTAGWPAVIGMSLAPSTAPVSTSIAKIDFMHDNVTQYAAGQQISHAADPYFRMYPEYNAGPCPSASAPCGAQVGQYSAWAWGVSRLIDGMEIAKNQLVNPLPIDIKHLGVNGCSYAGKMALFAGAFDERIAATFAQESGGGGAPAWRVSHAIEPEGSVEKTNNTDGSWFITSMKTDFGGNNVYKFPHDHHELMAMIAPRALFVSGNTDFTWLSNRSCYVSAKATQRIYETFGIGDRFGFWIDGNHGHCAIGAGEQPAIDAFYNKFLVGQNINWDVHVYPATPAFTALDYESWYSWWGTNDSDFPPEQGGKKIWLEAECGNIGADWDIADDTAASNNKYVTVKSGLNSTGAAPTGAGATVVLSFTIDSSAAYNFFARVNCPTADDDSYWIKIDDGNYVTANGLTTTGWQWVSLANATLSVGSHTLTIAYREDGAKLDKVLVTTNSTNPSGKGADATNCGPVNQKPVVTPGQQFDIDESVQNNDVIGTVTGSDLENSPLQNWQIVGGSGADKFSINGSNGEVTVANRAAIDFTSTSNYTLQVTVSDGSATSDAETVTINLLKNQNQTGYIIFAEEEVKFGENNYIGGDVGVSAADGKAEFKKYDVLDPYKVKAVEIKTDLPSSVNNKILQPANDGPHPVFHPYNGNTNGLTNTNLTANGTLNGNWKDVEVAENVTVTLTGNNFGKITIKEGATVTFTSSVINMEELNVKSGKKDVTTTNVLFSQPTQVKVEHKVKIYDDCRVNVDGPEVTFNLGDLMDETGNFYVTGKNTQVTANIIIPEGKLKVDKGTETRPTTMTGWYVIEKLESNGKYVYWRWNGSAQARSGGAATTRTEVLPSSTEMDGATSVKLYPNPARETFNIDLGTNAQKVSFIQVIDLSGKVVKNVRVTGESRITISSGNLLPGLYIIRLQGDRVISKKLVVQ